MTALHLPQTPMTRHPRGAEPVSAGAGDGSALRSPADLRMAYRSHAGEIHRYAARLTGDVGTAEEITQDVFLRAWRARDTFDGRTASLRTWLFAIAQNRVIDEARRLDRRPRTAGPPVESASTQPDHAAQLADRMRLEDAMEMLSPLHREVIDAVYVEGLTPTEHARRTGSQPGTVRRRLYDALREMRHHMTDPDLGQDQGDRRAP
ncbi:N/A [soil metagenome]